jgi:hypothetical protein
VILLSIKVKLQTIVEEMEVQSEETSTYLNRKTGEIITVAEQDFIDAEELESIDHLPSWQQEALRDACDVLENHENYQEHPTKYELNEYEMMEDFCYSINDPQRKADLLKAIKGKGAFRRFKDQVMSVGLDEQWYSFREERFKKLVIEWCKEHSIDFYE